MDERAYQRVARTLDTYGLWTSWCSQFLKEAGFKLMGMDHLERSLRDHGWTGDHVTLHVDIDPGSGFGYGLALVDRERITDTEHTRNWLKAVRDHLTDHHMNYVLEGKRSNCVSGAVVSH
ncbi:MAG: hypothetical protein JO029_00900 [Candidatus Eremiobacteraeota bacterium]|nr:hypothetical protein [Candidatus Eremiobacteraeota bacterium]MBV8283320.1 hypothetical protein [Candidatus Eremiobacteraeota bacterium]MBV8333001.1 hypothetical protein [Candidatus Eremiobacteraeota bacterium]MBV8432819.1 hypothetical protein [Candidatus Eremiobacteraeota bacterium]MBV8654572.1 hypothetical protein [Candidatus Eremiobacteraeota bacterium]